MIDKDSASYFMMHMTQEEFEERRNNSLLTNVLSEIARNYKFNRINWMNDNQKAAYTILLNAFEKMKENLLSGATDSIDYSYNKKIFNNSLHAIEQWYYVDCGEDSEDYDD